MGRRRSLPRWRAPKQLRSIARAKSSSDILGLPSPSPLIRMPPYLARLFRFPDALPFLMAPYPVLLLPPCGDVFKGRRRSLPPPAHARQARVQGAWSVPFPLSSLPLPCQFVPTNPISLHPSFPHDHAPLSGSLAGAPSGLAPGGAGRPARRRRTVGRRLRIRRSWSASERPASVPDCARPRGHIVSVTRILATPRART